MDLHFTLNPCVMSKKFKRVSDWSTAVSGSGTLNVTMYGGVWINPMNMTCATFFTQLCQNISHIGLCHMIIGQNTPLGLFI